MMLERVLEMNKVSIRKFEEKDIENKVNWINDSFNNKYLHYDLPLEFEKTKIWFSNNKNNVNRYDAVIEYDGVSVGLIGLLSIDNKNKKAEYYITMGEKAYLGKGIAKKASTLLLDYAFNTLSLNKIYLYTDVNNKSAINLYESLNFKFEGTIKDDLFYGGKYIDRYMYSITKKDFEGRKNTVIQRLDIDLGNKVYIKRDDLFPFSFGGNKARKALLFFNDIKKQQCDAVVTYGSSSSNHCRVIANLATKNNIKCFIISPESNDKDTYNKKMMKLFNAEIINCALNNVKETIDGTLEMLKDKGFKPYFIPGGGHGNIGTQAYVDCYQEIKEYEKENNINFKYIFHASGTGTTQAGLVCGTLINRDDKKVIGISIARKLENGRKVVVESISDYLKHTNIQFNEEEVDSATNFTDKYICDGYGTYNTEIDSAIKKLLIECGIPLDRTYTGKAFSGMCQYLKEHNIENENVLFIHTGGTPLFFDDLKFF